MLQPDELADTAAAFGVAEEQVRRDHLISHILAAVADLGLSVVFFGGTALGRVYLANPENGARLSEDIDLYGPDRRRSAAGLDDEVPRMLRREFPGARWEPALSAVRSADPAQLVTTDGMRVRIQLLDSGTGHHDYAMWPVEDSDVVLRYRDLPPTARLRSPTLTAFAAMKTLAWMDRRTARDLYDLAGLARLGALTQAAAELVRTASGLTVAPQSFQSALVPGWVTQLAHQTAVLPTADECLQVVRTAYAEALGWPPPYDPHA